MEPLKIALTKGRLEQKSVELFEKAGYDVSALRDPGRKLLLDVPHTDPSVVPLSAVLAKAPDVITYVERGVCELGIVGKDTIMELGKSFYEVLDLGFGKCRFALAARPETDLDAPSYRPRVIGTKYPGVTRAYFNKRDIEVDIVKIEGSVELAPLLGLADGIVDIVETGSTLRENGLVIKTEIAPVSARLIVNLAGMKMRKSEILDFINRTQAAL
ncbi:MAG: ATP phosphoribosyltransferase [Eubacteriales bacterium]|jgi:ATP phosphoribosyltransferase